MPKTARFEVESGWGGEQGGRETIDDIAEEELIQQLSARREEAPTAEAADARSLAEDEWEALLGDLRAAALRRRDAVPAATDDVVPVAGLAAQIRPPRHVGADGAVAVPPDQAPTMQERLEAAALVGGTTEAAPTAGGRGPAAPARHGGRRPGHRWDSATGAPVAAQPRSRLFGVNPILAAASLVALIGATGAIFAITRAVSGPDTVVVAAAPAAEAPASPAAPAPEAMPGAEALAAKASDDRVPDPGVRQIEMPPARTAAAAVTTVERGPAAPEAAGLADARVAPAAGRQPAEAPRAAEMAEAEAGGAGRELTPGSGADVAVSAYAPVPRTVDAHAELTATSRGTVLRAVNMRAGPDNGAATLGVLAAGTQVAVVDCSYWCEIVVEGRRGYVFNRFLDGPAAARAPGR